MFCDRFEMFCMFYVHCWAIIKGWFGKHKLQMHKTFKDIEYPRLVHVLTFCSGSQRTNTEYLLNLDERADDRFSFRCVRQSKCTFRPSVAWIVYVEGVNGKAFLLRKVYPLSLCEYCIFRTGESLLPLHEYFCLQCRRFSVPHFPS